MKTQIQNFFLLVLLTITILTFASCGNAFVSGDAIKEENSAPADQSNNQPKDSDNKPNDSGKSILPLGEGLKKDELKIDEHPPKITPEKHDNNKSDITNADSLPIQPVLISFATVNPNLNTIEPVVVSEKTIKKKLDEELNEKINTIKARFKAISEFKKDCNTVLSFGNNDDNFLKSIPSDIENFDLTLRCIKKGYFKGDIDFHRSTCRITSYSLDKIIDIRALINRYFLLARRHLTFPEDFCAAEPPKNENAPFFISFDNSLCNEILNTSKAFEKYRESAHDKQKEYIKLNKELTNNLTKINKWISLFNENNEFIKTIGFGSYFSNAIRKIKFNNTSSNVDDMLKLCARCEELIKPVRLWLIGYLSAYLDKYKLVYKYFYARLEYINKAKSLINLMKETEIKLQEKEDSRYSFIDEDLTEMHNSFDIDYCTLGNSIECYSNLLDKLKKSMAIVE